MALISEQAYYKFKTTKCDWNVIESNNSHNVKGWEKYKIFSCDVTFWCDCHFVSIADMWFDLKAHFKWVFKEEEKME